VIKALSAVTVIGSAILVGGIFGQGSVPTASLRTPLDFGAVGDGVTNDTVALQKAIDATQNGGSLYFPGGCKFLVRGLTATGEIHWLGPGGSWLSDRAVDGAVIIQGDNADVDLLRLDHAADSSITGIGFDGNKMHQSRPCNGLRMINCEFTRLDNVYVTSCSGTGILFENNNTLQTSDEIDLVDCYSFLNGQDGVRFDFVPPGGVWAPGDCEIIGGHYDFNSGNGVSLRVSSYTAISGANVLSNGLAGIQATYCTGLNMSTNMVRNNQHQGIVLGGGPQFTDCTNCEIIGNQIHLNSRAGVDKYSEVDIGFGSTDTRVIGNYCGDVHTSAEYPTSAKYGIWLHDGAKRTVVVGNSCPPSELVSGGFAADSTSSFTASANIGIADSNSSTGAMSPQTFASNGGNLGPIKALGGHPIWASVTGTKGGTLLLPEPSKLAADQSIVIKDEGGAAETSIIQIDGNGSKIDHQASIRIRTNYGSVRLRYDGTQWWSW